MITIKDIARLSGVGIATVSRVLNNTGSVSPETYRKVMKVISEYNYIPNSSARNLKTTSSNQIALLVKGFSNPFFQEMIAYIKHDISLRGYTMMLHDLQNVQNELDFAIQERRNNNTMAVILLGGNFNYTQKQFEDLQIPCVLLTISSKCEKERQYFSSVIVDDELEGFKATEYLISLGHRRIGFVYYNEGDKDTPNELRYQGYLRALKEHDIPFDPNLIAQKIPSSLLGYNGYRMGFDAFNQIYSANRDITALFCFSDILAIGAAKAALAAGLKIPDDLSVLGFDGISAAEYFHPSLDTIRQPAKEMANASVSLLFDMINQNPCRHLVYDCFLLNRGSTKKTQ